MKTLLVILVVICICFGLLFGDLPIDLHSVKIYTKRVVNQQPIYIKYRIKYDGNYTKGEEWERGEDGLYLFSDNDLPYEGMKSLQISSIAIGISSIFP